MAGATQWFSPSTANALASYARQTGLACSACHWAFPELTPTGRDFKLGAYTQSAEDKNITEEGNLRAAGLSVLDDVPLSVALQTSITATDKAQPSSQFASVEFPQAINFWLAGKITPNFGTLVQLTYAASSNALGGDSSDIRFAAAKTELAGSSLVWGIDANNNPTVEDLWNTTPAFGFPFVNPDSAGFGPEARTIIDGPLATNVIGGGPYFMWADHLYGLVELYRSQHLGIPQPDTGAPTPPAVTQININDVAPYWRVAWQQSIDKNNYIEVGTYGIYVSSFPNAVSGPTDSYLDLAGDLSYELTLPSGDMIILHGTYIHEVTDLSASVTLSAASQASDSLDTARVDLSYHFGNIAIFSAGGFVTWGTSDVLRYAAGFANGDPGNSGLLGQVAVWPWQNFEIGVQYRAFLTFNGAATNYDGGGRNASDNNTFYIFIWMDF